MKNYQKRDDASLVQYWCKIDVHVVVQALESPICALGLIATWCHLRFEFVVGSPLAPMVFSRFFYEILHPQEHLNDG